MEARIVQCHARRPPDDEPDPLSLRINHLDERLVVQTEGKARTDVGQFPDAEGEVASVRGPQGGSSKRLVIDGSGVVRSGLSTRWIPR